MEVRFFEPAKDYLRFKKEYDAAWESVNMRGDLILRKDVEEFEQRLADYVGTKYAIALNSGTDALVLSLKAMGWKRDAPIAVPSHTFKSTCGAVLTAGYKPTIYDMDKHPRLFGYNHEAVIVTHVAGEISSLPSPLNPAFVIEDACQAFGAIKNPTTIAQCWSFYPAKILGAKGDAGAVTTNDPRVYECVKEARNHFKTDNRDFGINSRMDNLQAALLNVKIQHIDEILNRRKEIAEKYLEELRGVELPNDQKGRVWQDFIIKVPNKQIDWKITNKYGIFPQSHTRNEFYEFLKKEGVETMKNEYPFTPEYPKLPLAARYEAETLRIPCNENLTDEEVEYVIKKINEFGLL